MIDVNIFKESKEEFDSCKEKEREFELEGLFNNDSNENSMDGADPLTADFPFIRKGFKYQLKHFFYMQAMKYYTKKVNREVTNLKVVGKENLKGIKGAIVTCNHISKYDSFAVRAAVGYDIMFVASEFNNWKGKLGEFSRHTGYIPLSLKLDHTIMKKFNEAIEYYLNKNRKILIYPEQAMWRDYKKPRPTKSGAFHYAVKHNVPIIPLFITIEDKKQTLDEQNRVNPGDYTIHILPPIYPKSDLHNKDNVRYMQSEQFRLCKECYEKTYNKKLTFTTKDWSKFDIFEV